MISISCKILAIAIVVISIEFSADGITHPNLGATRLKDGTIKQKCKTPGFHRSDQDCSQFFRCASYSPASRKFQKYDFGCPPGTIYDPTITGCNYPPKSKQKCTLQPLPEEPEQIQVIEEPSPKLRTWRLAQPLRLPANDTTYWCTFFKGPKILKKHHVVGFNVYLNGEASKAHTRHADLYKCTAPVKEKTDEFFEKYLGNGYDCYFSKQYFPVEHCELFELQWTIGGKATMFPDNVGVPIGEDRVEYYMTEIHYTNPNRLQGLTVNSGYELYHTEKLRTHDAGFIQVGAQSAKTYALTIPPNSAGFVHASHCSPQCTSNLPPQGINVFVYMLHSHLSGRKERLRHFRRNKELPLIAKDDNFNFDHQTNRPLQTHVKVLPGDQLTLECTYDTTWKRGGATLGGRSTRDEICQAFLMYYPRVTTINQCGSDFSQTAMLEFMGIQKVSTEKGVIDPTILEPPQLKGLKYSNYIEKIHWTRELRAEFQNMTRFGLQESYCFAPSYILRNGVQRIKYPVV